LRNRPKHTPASEQRGGVPEGLDMATYRRHMV
jgi:hypothetical protein